MRKFATCFIAFALYAPSVFGASVSRVIPATGSESGTNGTSVGASGAVARGGATANVSRVASRNINTVSTEMNNPAPKAVARTAVTRGVVSGTNMSNTSDATSVVARSAATRSAQRTGGESKLDAAVNTVGRNARVSAASINNNPALRRAGVTLRPSTAEVGGRATIAGTDVQTGSNVDDGIRAVTGRAATKETIAQAKERLEQTADLNKSCQEQYNDCMDQFCAVVDANQGRCSCSANLNKYTKVEEAVKEANAELNSVAQRIRYVGLSADEIRAILNETEAEEALSGQKDTTETRNMLADIEKLIKDPTTSSSSYSESSFGLDMSLDFSTESADIFSLDFLNLDSSGSFSNLRGAELYKAARSRCSTILNQCKSAGATSKQITGNYDLAIDKDCIAYEKGLKKMNDTLVSNVRSAEVMLQKARLAVLQNKNQYDAKGCIAALDACMRDDMVCGDDYFKCVDPTKRFIDENGEVVLGQNITLITQFMDDYNNAAIDKDFLEKSLDASVDENSCKTHQAIAAGTSDDMGDGACVTRYLMEKIGTGAKATDGGLCRAVLDKCQYYTYRDDQYQKFNDVVLNYIQRAMVNVRAAQHNIISEYASNCMVDVAQCYNNQVTQVNTWSSSASVKSIYNVMRGACRNVALTCGYAIFAGPPAIDPLTGNQTTGCPTAGLSEDYEINNAYITCISDMFYESLLCPVNSEYTQTPGVAGVDNYVNEMCKCSNGYELVGSHCKKICDASKHLIRNVYDECVCMENYEMQNGVCVAKSQQ